jgi:hypothetical protein
MQRMLSIVVASALILMVVSVANANTTYMSRLPATTTFRCLNCHNVQDPGPSQASLNAFGTAFKNNGFKWDATLAALGSDGDNCSNGFELGDQNGDGVMDPGVSAERSNPGQTDCTLQISAEAWSTLKQLFR